MKSRFIHVKFPSLKKANFVSMAYNSLPKYLIGIDLDVDSIKQEQEILAVLEEAKTMRDIDIQFPIAIEKMLDRKRKALIGATHEKTD